MSNYPVRSSDPATIPTESVDAPATARTSMDATSLLLELARALRGFSFFGETAPQRIPLVDRAFRALTGELERAGGIDFELGEHGFEVAGLPQPIDSGGVLEPLESVLQKHRLRRIRLDLGLSRNALHGLFDLLGQTRDRIENPESFVRRLEARDAKGIRINEIDLGERATTPRLSATPPRVSASLAAMRISAEALSDEHTLDSHPLDLPSPDDTGERLRARLIELDRTIDDESYQRRAADITIWAQELFDQGHRRDCYRALLVLADHAVGRGGRPETQARIAAARFAQLANGDCLNALIDRAIGPDGMGVRAAQLLLQLADSAVPAIFDRICREADPGRSALLVSLILTLGKASLPTLFEAIESDDELRVRFGIRLIGRLQNPSALPVLLAALPNSTTRLRDEIIRALGFLPGEASKQALADAQKEDSRPAN